MSPNRVDRLAKYFEFVPQNVSRRTSLPEESSTHTATYGRFLERPDVSGSVMVSWYPAGQLAFASEACAWKKLSRRRKPEVRCTTPDATRSASAPAVASTSCRP